MYSMVPTMAPPAVIVMPAVVRSRDPEVHDQGVAVGVDHDVGGFQIPVHDAGSCAAASPAPTCFAIESVRSTGSRPSRLRIDDRSDPWTYGIVMYLMPSISPRS